MENKEVTTSGKMTQLLIGNWLLWGIVLGILYKFAFNIVSAKIESIILLGVITVFLQGIVVSLDWKLSTSSSFSKKTISSEDVPKVMKNLIIFTVAICLLDGIYNVSKVNSSIDAIVDSNYSLKFTESMMSKLYSDSELEEYQKQKEEAINEAKNQLKTYLIIVEIGLTVVYLGALPLEKRELLKRVGGE